VKQYLEQLSEILDRGHIKEQRAVLRDGSLPQVKSLFGLQARYDLGDGFPLVTTKRIPFAAVAKELLWFLTGSTNNNDLKAVGVGIWNEWADDSGELGPVYGKQWRRWMKPDGTTHDQIKYIVEGIAAVKANPNDSRARRLILIAWNPPEMGISKAPTACHTMAQFNVTAGRLSCMMTQRSADMFLGVPFNIASYALLTHMLARSTGLDVGEFIHSIGDAHIYAHHFDQVATQLARKPKVLPKLIIDPAPRLLEDFRIEHFALEGYDPDPSIKGEVAV